METQKAVPLGPPARRKEIVEAARQIAALHGWTAVTVRAIGARIGCSAPAIYQYFRDKDAVLAALAEESRILLTRALEDAWDAQAGPGKRLRTLLRTFWMFALANRERYAALFGLEGLAPHPDARGRGMTPEIFVRGAADLLAKRNAQETSEDLADRLLATMHGFLCLALSDNVAGGDDRAFSLLSRVIEAVIRDIGRH